VDHDAPADTEEFAAWLAHATTLTEATRVTSGHHAALQHFQFHRQAIDKTMIFKDRPSTPGIVHPNHLDATPLGGYR
jgi:hypothetical protein